MIVSLDALLRRMSTVAENSFNKAGKIDMFWVVDTPTGQQVLHSPITCREAKDPISETIREHLRKVNAFRYAMACEVWMSTSPSVAPSEAPDRVELVHIEAVDECEQLLATREIIRPWLRKPYLGKLQGFAGEEIDRFNKSSGLSINGRFVNLLPNIHYSGRPN